jgi:hypothetical protein
MVVYFWNLTLGMVDLAIGGSFFTLGDGTSG